MVKIRTFIAIEIASAVKEKLSEVIDELKQQQAHIKWINPENIHITLKFLGDVAVNVIDEITTSLEIVAQNFEVFDLNISGVGVFPNERNPRVIWIGAQNTQNKLEALAEQIEQELYKLGFPKEKRPFKAHLTIGRVKSLQGIKKTIEKLNTKSELYFGNFLANEIIIMRSDLKPTGAIYTPLKKIKLK